MPKEDYYSILNVNKNANEVEIKKSYRRLAMKYHPDRNKGDILAEEKFKKVSEAYDVLSNPEKKKLYDTYGHSGIDPNTYSSNVNMNFSDIFGDIFGDVFGSSKKEKNNNNNGNDIYYKLDLTLEEAINGTNVKIGVKTLVCCKICNGLGTKGDVQICKTCKGLGNVRIQQGFFTIQQSCPKCNGEGNIVKDYCKNCMGDGRIEENVVLSVKIPLGVDTGDKIRLNGKGEAGKKNSPSGDLYIEINIKKHDIYFRKNIDLYCEIPINFIVAILGGIIEIPLWNEKIKIKVPPETQTGKIFRLKGSGIKSFKGDGPGDLYCTVIVEIPINLNEEQKKLLIDFDKSTNMVKCYPKISLWAETVKKFFK